MFVRVNPIPTLTHNRTGNKKRVLELLEKSGVNVNQLDLSGYSPLHYAARNNHEEICQMLLTKGANPNIYTYSGKSTPLHRAAYMGHLNIVKLLLKYKADLDCQDSDGLTPLHKAYQQRKQEVVAVLLESGANTQLLDIHGSSLLVRP